MKLCKLSIRRKSKNSAFWSFKMLGWTIYFWLIALLVGASAIARVYLFFTREIVTIYDLIESLISVIAIIGLYGFAYQTPLLNPTFWKIVWGLGMLIWIWSFFSAKNVEMIEQIGLAKGAAVFSLLSMLSVPVLVGLCLYSFRSAVLWSK